jgi:CheY-like chemotaxis protein
VFAPVALAMDSKDGKNRSILVVEDDPELLDGLAELLESEGYRVRRARHGLEALGHLRAGPLPAVILLDLMMPIMNGWQFRHEQRMDSEISKIPIVVISARTDLSAHAQWLEADGYLEKPVRPDILLATVARLCG